MGRIVAVTVAVATIASPVPAAGARERARQGERTYAAGRPRPSHGRPSGRAHADRGAADPLAGRGMWIWQLSRTDGGNLASIIATAHAHGIRTLMIKSGDGTQAWPQFNPALVAALHAGGLRVCAWQYVYGDHPISEAQVGAAAVADGADCLLADAESQYQGKYVQAQEYVRRLRQLIGPSFPVGLTGLPYVDYHPSFPYSVFLGPGGAQYDVPQMYWVDLHTSVDDVYAHTYEFNAVYGRPIDPLGQVSGNPPPRQIVRFRQLSRAYRARGVSWWDWQEATSRDWRAIARPVASLSGFAPERTAPTLSIRGQGGIWNGDLVVWAQEHLFTAGERIPIDGRYSLRMRVAVEGFQAAHGLPVTGVVDPVTWQALLRYRPVRVRWVRRGRTTAAIAAPHGR